ncbi:MAG: SPASM domain-containing protein, partial [Candidatus Diapherotrites archaeon]
AKLGVKSILYNFSLPSIEKGEVASSYSLDPKTCATAAAKAYRELKKEGIHVSFFATLPYCLFEKSVLKEMLEDQTISSTYQCHTYYGTGVAFEPNGNVLPCTHYVDTPLFNAMDQNGKFAMKGKFAQEWKEKMHNQFSKELWKYPAKACKDCHFWGRCIGGCPFLWMLFDPEQFIQGGVNDLQLPPIYQKSAKPPKYLNSGTNK